MSPLRALARLDPHLDPSYFLLTSHVLRPKGVPLSVKRPEAWRVCDLSKDALKTSGSQMIFEKPVTRIAGTEDSVFPLNEGWILEGSKHTRLTEIFKIHNMTQYLTMRIVGDAKPNAEDNWNKRVSYPIPWKRVWASLGTPLSDPSEEKQWRKLLQRALNTRNRDTRAPSKRCRLGCNCDESMLHLAQCPKTARLWKLLLSALQAFDETPPQWGLRPLERAIIFGIRDDSLALLPMVTRATFRHAWQALYRNLTLVDVN